MTQKRYWWEKNGNDAEPPLSICDKHDGVIAYCMDERVAEQICRLLPFAESDVLIDPNDADAYMRAVRATADPACDVEHCTALVCACRANVHAVLAALRGKP